MLLIRTEVMVYRIYNEGKQTNLTSQIKFTLYLHQILINAHA